MALETELFQQDPFGYIMSSGLNKDFHAAMIGGGSSSGGGSGSGGGPWNYGYFFQENDINIHPNDLTNDNRFVGHGFNNNLLMDLEYCITSPSSMELHNNNNNNNNHYSTNKFSSTDSAADYFTGNYTSSTTTLDGGRPPSSHVFSPAAETTQATTTVRRKRRRIRSVKNKEEVENQRMTHIAVERNRRKQMNDYLAVLRSMMPSSYVQRGDQASIVGGAINFVKELEQLLQFLEAQKRSSTSSTTTTKKESSPSDSSDSDHSSNNNSDLFSDFFIFPQYSTCSSSTNNNNKVNINDHHQTKSTAEKRSAVADVEVTMVESHANIKVLQKSHHNQLLKMVVGLQLLRLVVLHLNVTTVDNMVLYSFSVKVEDDSQLSTVNEIAASVFEMVGRIQEENCLLS
ncbi:transcription factor bHLH94 [Cannabis sativa]|uniref:transcription factor bHLH94 n=1 Tax=Cannabis sativa TaxID=3483 RepID=UPI0029CA4283|nr:transcription factor bHLH94 [Cannabis sativa]